MTHQFALAALMLISGGPLFAAANPDHYMSADLIAESRQPAPGSTTLVGFRMRPRPGWHGYWSNPGDSGIAPTVRWSAPDGVKFGPLLHPAPTLIRANGISSYVHDGEHVLLSRMTVPRTFAPGTPIPVTAELSWAACTATQCVPLHAKLTLALTAGNGSKSADWPLLQTAVRKLPRQARAGSFVVDGKSIRLLLPASLELNPRTVRFFPDTGEAWDTAAARAERRDGTLSISGPAEGTTSGSISGVVSDGRTAYRLSFLRASEPQSRAEPAESAEQVGPPKPEKYEADKPSLGRRDPVESSTDVPRKSNPSWLWISVVAAFVAAAGLMLGWRLSRRRSSPPGGKKRIR
ncbi:MAG TPA: protein-disulfide reductase DsbD domain-containing protein [Sphingomicrobium sp.]|nr:protein-disulfide reductase DsbD domain-containing protein [Sphingomicrobium sp.]